MVVLPDSVLIFENLTFSDLELNTSHSSALDSWSAVGNESSLIAELPMFVKIRLSRWMDGWMERSWKVRGKGKMGWFDKVRLFTNNCSSWLTISWTYGFMVTKNKARTNYWGKISLLLSLSLLHPSWLPVYRYNPSGVPSCFRSMTRSRAVVKSCEEFRETTEKREWKIRTWNRKRSVERLKLTFLVTLILRSRRAKSPASVAWWKETEWCRVSKWDF